MEGQDALFSRCEKQFGFRIRAAEPVSLGWLNKKWILHTSKGKLVLKKYHPRRYKDEATIRNALMQQQRLSLAGFAAPGLLESGGEIVFADESGDLYIVMEYCEGSRVEAGKADWGQMHDLGRATGELHRLLNDGTLPANGETSFIPPSLEESLVHWDGVIDKAIQENKPHLVPVMEQQKKMAQSLDLQAIQQACRKGWAHRDLWMDNLLFRGESVSAVLDFDRLNFDYLELDIARAILSGAFQGERLDLGRAEAFLHGYGESAGVTVSSLADIIRFLWALESKWWINAEMDGHHRIPGRFAEEMLWISRHDERLDELLHGL